MLVKSAKILIVAMILVLGTTAAWAQGRFEITPFVGYRTTGSFSGGQLDYTDFHIKDGLAYGVSVGYAFSPLFTLEFQWSRSDSSITAHGPTLASTKLADATTDVYHGNFLFFFRPVEYKLRPFFVFGLGATVVNPKNATIGANPNPGAASRFSWNLGLGAQYQATNRIGLRLQARWLPCYINSSSAWFIDWWGYPWLVPVSNYMNQFEFTGGLTFRF